MVLNPRRRLLVAFMPKGRHLFAIAFSRVHRTRQFQGSNETCIQGRVDGFIVRILKFFSFFLVVVVFHQMG